VTGRARRAALVGVGYTALTRSSGRSVLSLAREACANAVEDAGLTPAEVNGISSFAVMHDSIPGQAVATVLAVPELKYCLDLDLGGQAPCHLVHQAATAVESGQADTIVVFRAMNGRSAQRVGDMRFAGPGGAYRYPIGYGSYLMYVAMWARRFLYETGQDERDLAGVAIAQRRWAVDNDRAIRTEPLDLDTYCAAPYVTEPFRAADCTTEVDGACAVVVTTLERARDLRHAPVLIASGAYRAGAVPGLDIGDHLGWPDYSRNFTSVLAADLFGQAGLTPADLDLAEIYDCFTSTVLMGLEGLGICERGESGAFVRSGATSPGGRLPVNTHGGLLAEGYVHGMNTVAEAVLQLQGRGGSRQVPGARNCVVTSGAMMDGSALILTAG
jgi:acetyl-CoA acetyltransferase